MLKMTPKSQVKAGSDESTVEFGVCGNSYK
jgi:hypothetical protein